MVDVVVEMKNFSILISIKEEEITSEGEVSEEAETMPVAAGAENQEEAEVGVEIFVTTNVEDPKIINLLKKKELDMRALAEGSREAEVEVLDVLLGGRTLITLKKWSLRQKLHPKLQQKKQQQFLNHHLLQHPSVIVAEVEGVVEVAAVGVGELQKGELGERKLQKWSRLRLGKEIELWTKDLQLLGDLDAG